MVKYSHGTLKTQLSLLNSHLLGVNLLRVLTECQNICFPYFLLVDLKIYLHHHNYSIPYSTVYVRRNVQCHH